MGYAVTPRACASGCTHPRYSADVVAIVAGGVDLKEPVNLSPSHSLRCCLRIADEAGGCDDAYVLVNNSLRAFMGKPTRWRWARLVFADGYGVSLRMQGDPVGGLPI